MPEPEAISFPGWSQFVSGMGSFFAAADVHTVLVILVLSVLLKHFLWPYWKWPLAYLAFVPLGLSFLVTPMMSLTAEVSWGGSWYFRQALYNGIAGEALFHLGLPYCQKHWPQVFVFLGPGNGQKDDPNVH